MTNKILNPLQSCRNRRSLPRITFIKKRPESNKITLLFISLKRIGGSKIKHQIKHNMPSLLEINRTEPWL